MRSIVVAAILAAGSVSSHAHYILKIDDTTVRLMDAPCEKKVKDLLRPEFHDKFRKAVVIFKHRTLQACWITSSPDAITLIDEAGDGTTLPIAAFSKAGGV